MPIGGDKFYLSLKSGGYWLAESFANLSGFMAGSFKIKP